VGERDAVLVTGAAGSVGHLLVDLLRAAGQRVIASDLPGSKLPTPSDRLEIRAVDLTSPGAAERLTAGANRVIHTAAVVDIASEMSALEASNVQATLALHRAAVQAGIERFVFLSSGSIYRLNPTGTYRESDPLEANNDYERSKIACERHLLQAAGPKSPELIILRPSLIYGPRARHLGALLACLGPVMKASLPVVFGLKGGPRINWVHAEDVARAALHLLEQGQPGEAYNVADDDAFAFGDLVTHSLETYGLVPAFLLPYPPMGAVRGAAGLLQFGDLLFTGLNKAFDLAWEQVCDRHGLERELIPRLDRQAFVYGHRHFLVLNDKLRQTGFEPRYPSIQDGWAPTIAWYQQHRWVPTYAKEAVT